MPKGRLAVPAQPMARPREHMSCMMRHPNRVQDRKTLLVRNRLQTRAALPVTQPIQPSCAAPCPAEAPVSEQPTIRPSRSRTRCPRLSPTGVDKPRQGNRSRTACGETVRSRCNLNRSNLQRRQRTRNRRGYRPVNVWPSPIRHSPTEAATTRETQCRKPGQAFPRSSHAESRAAEVMTKRATKFLPVPLAGGVVDTASRKEGWGRDGAIFSCRIPPPPAHCGEGGVRRTWNFRKAGRTVRFLALSRRQAWSPALSSPLCPDWIPGADPRHRENRNEGDAVIVVAGLTWARLRRASTCARKRVRPQVPARLVRSGSSA